MPGQKFGPAWFPGLIAVGLAICGGLLIFRGLRERSPWVTLPEWIHSRRARAGIAALVCGLAFYVLAAGALGFHLTGIVLLVIWMRLLGATWRVTLPVAILSTLVIHFAFYQLLRVPLPWGVLEPWAF
jgi:putative tricarboxylic transport membrane protein